MEYGPECIPEAVKYRWDVNDNGVVVSKGNVLTFSEKSRSFYSTCALFVLLGY